MDCIRHFMESPGTSINSDWLVHQLLCVILKKFTFYKSKGGERSKKKWEGKENVLIFQLLQLYSDFQYSQVHRGLPQLFR